MSITCPKSRTWLPMTCPVNSNYDRIMTATRLLFVSAILLPALLACSPSNEKWENDPDNDRKVHISGTVENLSPRDVRIALAGTDVVHGGAYYTIKVRNGRFSADVPLDRDKVYELLIPVRHGYFEQRYQVSFATQDTLVFSYDNHENQRNAPKLILNPAGDNEEYLTFRAVKKARFADEDRSLDDEYASIREHFYSAEYDRLCDDLNDRSLDQSARDTIRLLIGQMNADRTAYTPEGRAYLARQDEVGKKKLDFAREYLEARPASLALFEVLYESIRSASDLDHGYHDWLQYYEREYSRKFQDCNLHQLVHNVISSTSIREGGRFIDFTLPDKDGVPRTLSQLIDGKVAVLEFWATWCRSCIVNRNAIREVYDRNKEKGFVVVEVAREIKDDSKWRSYIEKDGADWTDLLAMEENHAVGNAYGCGIKAGGTFLIDRNGCVIKVDPTREEIEAALAGL